MADGDCVLKLKVTRPNTQKGEFDERIFKNAIDRAIGGKVKSVSWVVCVDKLTQKKRKAKKEKKMEEEEVVGEEKAAVVEGKKEEEKEEEEKVMKDTEEKNGDDNEAGDAKVYRVAVKFVNKEEVDKMRAHIAKGKGAMGCKLEILEMDEEESEAFWTRCTNSVKKAKLNSKKIRGETKEKEAATLKAFSKHIDMQRKMLFDDPSLKRKAQPTGKKKAKKPKKK